FKSDSLGTFFDAKYYSGTVYAKKLSLRPEAITKKDFEDLKITGFSEGEILEINQVTSYFNYVNRSVMGLGISTEGDILGLSPGENDDPENWGHS
ncbi:MAG: alkylhydroperoxidase, partial [Aurantibacter sp.]